MSRFIGEAFEGVISGVTNWGLYVELPNTVEGLIRIQELSDDYYLFDEPNYQLIGETTGKTYKLGQKIKVVVAKTENHRFCAGEPVEGIWRRKIGIM